MATLNCLSNHIRNLVCLELLPYKQGCRNCLRVVLYVRHQNYSLLHFPLVSNIKNPLVVHQSPLSSSHLNPTPYSLPFSYNPQQQPISSVVYSPISQPPTVMNLLRCPFVECEKKAWFRGFALKEDYDFHLSLHRCQWTVISQDGAKFASCRFIPSSTDEAVSHLEKHIENDQLPQIRAADNTSQVPGEARRTMYFCPIQTCSSDSYCRKGSTNKAHLLQHIRKHLGL